MAVIKMFSPLLIIAIGLLFIEIYSGYELSTQTEQPPSEDSFYYDAEESLQVDPDVGLKGGVLGITTEKGIYTKSDQVFFDVKYQFDEYGRRTVNTHNKTPQQEHLLIFGGSFSFGTGLNEEDTLQNKLYIESSEKLNTYDYSFYGYGMHQMLANLERPGFREEILGNKGNAVYVYIDNHIRRAIGDMEWSTWHNDVHYPYYYLNNGLISRNGSFATGRAFATNLYRFLKNTSTFKHFGINLPLPSPEHTELAAKIVIKSSNTYKEMFEDSDFYVLIHPYTNKHLPETIEFVTWLENNDVNVLQPELVDWERPSDFTISEHDVHPNGYLNELIAKYIFEKLR